MPLQYDLSDMQSMDPADHVSLPQRGCAAQPRDENASRPPTAGEPATIYSLSRFAWWSNWRNHSGATGTVPPPT